MELFGHVVAGVALLFMGCVLAAFAVFTIATVIRLMLKVWE